MSTIAANSTDTAPEPSLEGGRGKQRWAFMHHAAIYGLGSMSVQMVSFVLLPIYTHTLSTSEYGLLQFLYRVGDVFNICLMVNGIRTATFNFWGKAETESERRHLAASVSVFTALVLSVGALFTIFGSKFLADQFGVDGRLMTVGVLAIMLQATTVMPMALMQARLESTWFVVSTLLTSICHLTLVAFALIVLDWGVWGVVLAIAATYGCIGTVLTVRELTRSSFLPEKHQLWKLARFSAPFIPGGLCFFVLHNGDQFFLLHYFGTATLGVYALGYRITKGVVMFAFQPLLQVWCAWMYDVYKRPAREVVFGQAFTRMVGTFSLAGAAIVVFQHEVIQLLGSPQFAGAATVIGPLVLAHFFLVFSYLLDGAFYVTRRTDLKSWIALASMLVTTVAYALLIPRWAAQGAAMATLVGFAFHCSLTMWMAQRTFRVEIEYRRLAILFTATTLVGCLGSWMGTGAMMFVLKLAMFGALIVGLWCSGVVTEEEKKFLLEGYQKVARWRKPRS